MALIQVNFVSKCLLRTVPIQVILPVDQHPQAKTMKEEKPFKTLYLLHGIYGNHTDWVTNTRIQKWAEEKNLAVVMPAGDNSFYLDFPEAGNLYGEFIGRELVEMTRRMFPLSRKREDTFIGGLSMGGYGALRSGLKYCDTFSHIATLSGALHILEENGLGPIAKELSCFGDLKEAAKSDKNPRVLLEKIHNDPAASFPRIYGACGTEDFLYAANCTYRKILEGYDIDLTWEEFPGHHDWDFWDMAIRRVLDWLPLDK